MDPAHPRTVGPGISARHGGTRQSNIYVAQAARTRAFRGSEQLDAERSLFQMEDYIQQVLRFDVSQGEPIRVEKLVSLYTSRDRAINEPLTNAGKSVRRYPGFDEALPRPTRPWEELLRSCDLHLPGAEHVQPFPLPPIPPPPPVSPRPPCSVWVAPPRQAEMPSRLQRQRTAR